MIRMDAHAHHRVVNGYSAAVCPGFGWVIVTNQTHHIISFQFNTHVCFCHHFLFCPPGENKTPKAALIFHHPLFFCVRRVSYYDPTFIMLCVKLNKFECNTSILIYKFCVRRLSIANEGRPTAPPAVMSTDSANVPQMRLSKLISNTGYCSRREAEKWIGEGRVSVNGQSATGRTLVSIIDRVDVDGVKINVTGKKAKMEVPKLWGINKMRGELVATEDNKNRKVLFDRLRSLPQISGAELKPVSHLGFNTEGLCLFSNNGLLSRTLNKPGVGLTKVFRVRVHGLVTEDKLEGLRKGMYIDAKKQPKFNVTLEKTSGRSISWLKVGMVDGGDCKLLKRCLEKMHLDVTRMICTQFGPYSISKIDMKEPTELRITPDVLALFRKNI